MASTQKIAYFNPVIGGPPVTVQVDDVASINKSDIAAFQNSPAEYHIVITFISAKPTQRIIYTTGTAGGLIRRNNAFDQFMVDFGDAVVGS